MTLAILLCFFFNDTATTEIYTLSLHDALPIWGRRRGRGAAAEGKGAAGAGRRRGRGPRRRPRSAARGGDRQSGFLPPGERKSTRLNSSQAHISDVGLCL